MKYTFTFLLALMVVVASAPAVACIPTPPEEKVKALDGNGDGKVSANEYKADFMKRGADELKRAEAPEDPKAPKAIGETKESRVKWVKEFYTEAKAQEFFAKLDRNKDGFITVDEFAADASENMQKC